MNSIPDLINQLHSIKIYPEAAMNELMERKEESTPLLLSELATFVENYKHIKQGWAHIYVLYILSYFKEQRAFPYITKMMLFSSHWTSMVFDEHVMYNLERWMLCTYDGNMQAIKQVIENETADMSCRIAAIKCLVGLFATDQLERSVLIDYLRILITSDLSKDYEFAEALVDGATAIYAQELYSDIKKLYELNRISNAYFKFEYVDRALHIGYGECLQHEVYNKRYYFTLEQVIEDTAWSDDDWNLDCLQYPHEHAHDKSKIKAGLKVY